MSRNPWHKRYHSDALNGYMCLSLEERGAYSTILDLLYDRGEPILDNERLLAGHLGVSIRKARSMVETLISKGKIYRTDDGHISNSRFDLERENELKSSRKHAENGSKGGRERAERAVKLNHINEDAQAGLEPSLSLNQKPEPDLSEAKASAAPAAPIVLDETELFRRGKSVLGQKAGGVITSLRKTMGGVGPAYGVIVEAAAKQDPMEWVQAVMRQRSRRLVEVSAFGMCPEVT